MSDERPTQPININTNLRLKSGLVVECQYVLFGLAKLQDSLHVTYEMIRSKKPSEAAEVHIGEPPVVVCVGATGVGKSAFCRALTGDYRFVSASTTSSVTDWTEGAEAHWLGLASKSKLIVIDTPGISDSEGDVRHIYDMVSKLQFRKQINTIVLLLNSEQCRCDGIIISLLRILHETFREDIWKNVVLGFTRWYSDEAAQERRRLNGESQDYLAKKWTKTLCEKLEISEKTLLAIDNFHKEGPVLPCIFVDSLSVLLPLKTTERKLSEDELERAQAPFLQLQKYSAKMKPLQTIDIECATLVRDVLYRLDNAINGQAHSLLCVIEAAIRITEGYIPKVLESKLNEGRLLWAELVKNDLQNSGDADAIYRTLKTAVAIGAVGPIELKKQLVKLKSPERIPISECRDELGFTASDCMQTAYSAKECTLAGLVRTAADCKKAGYRAVDCKKAGYSLRECTGAGYTAADFYDAGHSLRKLIEVGFTLEECCSAGYSAIECKAAGFNVQECFDAGYKAAACKEAGYSFQEVLDVGYSLADCCSGGYSMLEVLSSNSEAKSYSLSEFHMAGYSLDEAVLAGFSMTECASAGYAMTQVSKKPRNIEPGELPADPEAAPLVLVQAGSCMQVIFEHAKELAEGKTFVPLTVKVSNTKGLKAIVNNQASETRHAHYHLIKPAVGDPEVAVRAILEDGFLTREDDSYVFDVQHWKYEVGNTLWMLKEHDDASLRSTRNPDGGRSFKVNLPLGTISPVRAPNLVLGVASPKLVLVEKDSPKRCIFSHAKTLMEGGLAPLSFTLSNEGVFAIIVRSENLNTFKDMINYLLLTVGPAAEAPSFKVRYEDCKYLTREKITHTTTIASENGDVIGMPSKSEYSMVFDVAFGKMESGNDVNLVQHIGENHGGTKNPENAGRLFAINVDGTIAPKAANGLVLGVEFIPGFL
eukprot:gnl/MRDRNA2_/MRDRNA2_30471_c0_seq1.p1 gnl/MRDRNA2_/MRDRNA2_30471_c0~~gnl/MRDRNA2_/MRDRNA2_30471_c0_seq1.p1  ORF type:complete len:954 (-),score=149.58 gnl/MRDRNA2_/MRDRNA2_30471_c0_seq1:567-3368(-)